MRVAMLSWRYLGHPQGGGAEVVTHEALKRCVERGWDVTVFTATFPGSSATQTIDGVKLIRRGVQHTVHACAWRWLRVRLNDFDRVIEQINTLPFLTPLYVPAPKRRLLIFQLAREYWFRETRGVFRFGAPFGYALEPLYLRLYRSTPTMTISESSRADLARLGLPVTTLIPMAVHTPAVPELAPRTGPLRLVVVGRLTRAKFVEDALVAFREIQQAVPQAGLDVVGAGDAIYRQRLEDYVRRWKLRNVTFHGRVDDARKRALLAAAHVHVFCSRREGWGLTVTEAARVGTPTVGYDAPGVRDSVADRRLLAPKGDPAGLARRVLALQADPRLYDEVRTAAWKRAKDLDWDDTAEAFIAGVA